MTATRAPTAPCPLPLYIRGPEGTTGQLASGRAEQQAAAIDAALRYLLGYPHPAPVPERIIAECVLGFGVEYAHPAQVPYRRNVYPLVEMGWRTADCQRRLAIHDLAYVPDVACIACTNCGNVAWAELRATDPQAWQEAVATDAILRNYPTTAVPSGMPPGATAYLPPDRVPLSRGDLDAATNPEPEGCLPQVCCGAHCVFLSGVDHGVDTVIDPAGTRPGPVAVRAGRRGRKPVIPSLVVTVRFLTGCRFQAAVRTNTDLAPR